MVIIVYNQLNNKNLVYHFFLINHILPFVIAYLVFEEFSLNNNYIYNLLNIQIKLYHFYFIHHIALRHLCVHLNNMDYFILNLLLISYLVDYEEVFLLEIVILYNIIQYLYHQHNKIYHSFKIYQIYNFIYLNLLYEEYFFKQVDLYLLFVYHIYFKFIYTQNQNVLKHKLFFYLGSVLRFHIYHLEFYLECPL